MRVIVTLLLDSDLIKAISLVTNDISLVCRAISSSYKRSSIISAYNLLTIRLYARAYGGWCTAIRYSSYVRVQIPVQTGSVSHLCSITRPSQACACAHRGFSPSVAEIMSDPVFDDVPLEERLNSDIGEFYWSVNCQASQSYCPH